MDSTNYSTFTLRIPTVIIEKLKIKAKETQQSANKLAALWIMERVENTHKPFDAKEMRKTVDTLHKKYNIQPVDLSLEEMEKLIYPEAYESDKQA